MVLRNSYEGELHAFRAVFRRHRFGATSYVTKKGFPQMSFGKKIIAGVAAVATLAALAPAVAMADTAQNQNSATSSQAKEEYATVTFYTADGHSIQGVTWQKGTAFSQYALGIQAPAVEGKTFTGWGFASNDGNVAVNPDAEVTGNWAVYAMYKDAPTDDSKKDDSKPADTTKKNDTKGNTKKTVAQKIKKAVLGNTGATVGGVAVFAVIALLGFAGITVLRKRA